MSLVWVKCRSLPASTSAFYTLEHPQIHILLPSSMVCLSIFTTKCRQNGSHLDSVEGQPEQGEVTGLPSSHGCRDSHTSRRCTESWCLSRLWTVHETTRRRSCQHLLLPLTLRTSSASMCRKRHHHPFGAGSHHVKTGLLQLGVGGPFPVDTPATSKSPECRRTAHLWRSISQTHHSPSARAALASGLLKNWIQAVLDNVQCTQRTSPTCCSRQIHHHVHFVCAPPTRRVTSSRDFGRNSENGHFPILVQRHGINFRAHETTVVSLCF